MEGKCPWGDHKTTHHILRVDIMAFIIRGAPEALILYATSALPPSTVESLKSGFGRGAFEKYDPLLKLVVSERTDLYGWSSEAIMCRLQEEASTRGNDPHKLPPFILADEHTVATGEVVFVEKWATRDLFREGGLVEQKDWPKGRHAKLPFTIKLRIDIAE
ncbi:hypothetical protein JAAARDRAFT_444795 [Jaapia argillacea MUCL 33604]|uniref:Uncharacterized protein n=1 Tax=Jaapia argillacea MUCL 33604 TaxID=933084 RepID=A0A067PNF0_9AGAM|nr:hypothetical protein JAAARDRAFT_444795 [Jaapia argillacea MUCL 33604]